MEDGEAPRCLMSHPAHPHNLSCSPGNTKSDCFTCNRKLTVSSSAFHYYCKICDVEFHDDCHQLPRKITHPYHFQHSLIFTLRNYTTKIISNGNITNTLPFTFLSNTSKPVDISPSLSDIIFDKCSWCGKKLDESFYRCPICSFSLDLDCAKNIPPLTLTNPKNHHHSLFFFPRPLLVPCDACGLITQSEPSYACFQCNYMVHQSCIQLPRVIKITRHPHRLSYTPYLPPAIPSCRVCYKKVDIKYGQYSCTSENCSYVAHSKCATHEKVWDGRELEWEPEEPNQTEDIAPFKKISDDLIHHFSHEHHLRLEKYDGVRDLHKQCQACILPIQSHDFYNCIECDFSLHEVCANLPRKLDHALHKHPLILDPCPRDDYLFIRCSACFRVSAGFRYLCPEVGCTRLIPFQIDVCCILVPEFFTHKSHEHPLFISISSSGDNMIFCYGCNKSSRRPHLQCTLETCEFSLCYECATIPHELYYKYDEHLLSLCYGEDGDNVYWCEVCEEEVDATEWFYTCNKCCITIHRNCLFGSSIYMKVGFTFDWDYDKVEVIRNGISTRPVCRRCNLHCPHYVYFKLYRRQENIGMTICSFSCLMYASQI